MFREGQSRTANAKRTHFGTSAHTTGPVSYPHQLSFYTTPPTSEITLDQFEQWAIDRLRSAYLARSSSSYPPSTADKIHPSQSSARLSPANTGTKPLKKQPPSSNPSWTNTFPWPPPNMPHLPRSI